MSKIQAETKGKSCPEIGELCWEEDCIYMEGELCLKVLEAQAINDIQYILRRMSDQ